MFHSSGPSYANRELAVTNMTWKTIAYLLIVAGLIAPLGADSTLLAAEDNYFKMLQEQLVADGFDQSSISGLYDHDGVSFDVKGISLFFRHTEAKLNYDLVRADSGIGFHNPRYARAILRYSISSIQAESGWDQPTESPSKPE